MTIEKLCEWIELQDSITIRVKEVVANYDLSKVQHILDDLTEQEKAEKAYKSLVAALGDDEDCIKMLTCQLLCAVRLYDRYREKNISDQIYVDTMKCFTRFIGECKAKTGKYAFDRGWWSYRQISMVLFRIGELEYELLEEHGVKTISLHIPSDAKFTEEKVDASIASAKEVIARCFPQYADCEYICDSWLLAPKLQEVLNEDSHILSFQKRFRIVKQNVQAPDVYEWLFKTTADADIRLLKEDTTLQRRVKELLQRGEKVGIAFGVMK